MYFDPDVFRGAKLLVAQYGVEAEARATERLATLLQAGDAERALIWRQILKAVEELVRGPRPGEPVN